MNSTTYAFIGKIAFVLAEVVELFGQPLAFHGRWTDPEHFVVAVVHFGRSRRCRHDRGGEDSGRNQHSPRHRVPPPDHFGEREKRD